MSRGVQIPEGGDFTEAWRALDRDTKRRIRRAVNRAQPADNRREAALAVAVARGQQRFWRFGWLFGPLLAVMLLAGEPAVALVANGIFAAVVFGVLSLFLIRRARRAERVNREAVAGGKPAEGGRSQRTRRAARRGRRAAGGRSHGARKSRKQRKRR
jgi:hypothetical protein